MSIAAVSSGTSNATQCALQVSQPQIVSAQTFLPNGKPVVSLTNYPVSLMHGGQEWNWPDPALLNAFNVIWNQTLSLYRI